MPWDTPTESDLDSLWEYNLSPGCGPAAYLAAMADSPVSAVRSLSGWLHDVFPITLIFAKQPGLCSEFFFLSTI